VRLLTPFLLLLGCATPCPLVCADNSECVQGYYCLNQSACLRDCLQRCNGACVETFSNCGRCGLACAGGEVCSLGLCKSACDANLTSCSGSCYDLKTDRTHCGGCTAVPCADDQTCVNGVCTKVDVCS